MVDFYIDDHFVNKLMKYEFITTRTENYTGSLNLGKSLSKTDHVT